MNAKQALILDLIISEMKISSTDFDYVEAILNDELGFYEYDTYFENPYTCKVTLTAKSLEKANELLDKFERLQALKAEIRERR